MSDGVSGVCTSTVPLLCKILLLEGGKEEPATDNLMLLVVPYENMYILCTDGKL